MSMKIDIWNKNGVSGLNFVLKVKTLTLSLPLWNKHMAFIVHSEGKKSHLIYLIFSLKIPELKETFIWNLKQILLIRSV